MKMPCSSVRELLKPSPFPEWEKNQRVLLHSSVLFSASGMDEFNLGPDSWKGPKGIPRKRPIEKHPEKHPKTP